VLAALGLIIIILVGGDAAVPVVVFLLLRLLASPSEPLLLPVLCRFCRCSHVHVACAGRGVKNSRLETQGRTFPRCSKAQASDRLSRRGITQETGERTNGSEPMNITQTPHLPWHRKTPQSSNGLESNIMLQRTVAIVDDSYRRYFMQSFLVTSQNAEHATRKGNTPKTARSLHK
jgi:hypothetical protein